MKTTKLVFLLGLSACDVGSGSLVPLKSTGPFSCVTHSNGTTVSVELTNVSQRRQTVVANNSIIEAGAEVFAVEPQTRFVGILRTFSHQERLRSFEPGERLMRTFDIAGAFAATGGLSTHVATVKRTTLKLRNEVESTTVIECQPVEVTLTPLDVIQQRAARSQAALTTTSCSAIELQILEGYHRVGGFSTSDRAIQGTTNYGHPDYVTWFGSYTWTRGGAVRAIHSDMNAWFSSPTHVYECHGCDSSDIVGQANTLTGVTRYCNAFWTDDRLEQLATVLHEVSHVTSLTEDHVYTRSGAQALAVSNPEAAVDNAENHSYFLADRGLPRLIGGLVASF